jgi:hypothetical protein
MAKIPDDLAPLKDGIHAVAAGDRWARDTPAWNVAEMEKSDITPPVAAAFRLTWTDYRERIADLLNRRPHLPGGTCLLFPYFSSAGEQQKPTDPAATIHAEEKS